MFKFIEGLPLDVLAIEAIGTVTSEDYRHTLVPAAEAMIAKGPIRMIYVIGKEFKGFELEALCADGAFGFKHLHDFSRVAVVTDHVWMGAAVNMFKPFFHAEVRLFGLSELPAAKDWIVAAKRPTA
jgi:hypothetical protein